MPDVTTTLDTAVFLIIIGNFDTIEDSFRSCNLVRTHNHQHILGRKNAVLRKNIQNRVPCEKGLCKINQIRNNTVIGICPKTGKLKTVTGLGFTRSFFLMLFFRIPSGTVGIIFRIRSIGNNKNLNILIQSASCPERIPLIAVDLVECLADGYSSTFQLNMYKRQTIDKNRNIIAVIMLCAVVCANHTAQVALSAALGSIHLVLVDYLQPVIMDVLFIYKCNILGRTIITGQDLNIIFLYLPGLFHDMLIGIGNGIFEKVIPLCVRKLIAVQFL